MIYNSSKITLGILALFFLVILFVPFNQNGIGFLFVILTGLASLSAAGFISNDLKKLNNSKRSKILSIILVSTILFALTWLFYNLGNIGGGDMGILGVMLGLLLLLMWGISIIAGIIRVVGNKVNSSEGHPNKILLPATILILVASFFTPLVFWFANASGNPLICRSIPEFKDSLMSFRIGIQDICVYGVAVKTSRADYCKLLKNSDNMFGDPDSCLFNIAVPTYNLNLCNQIENAANRANCIGQIKVLIK